MTDEVDINAAIAQVVEKYPHFAKVEESEEGNPKPNFTTGNHNTNNNQNDPFAAKLAKYN